MHVIAFAPQKGISKISEPKCKQQSSPPEPDAQEDCERREQETFRPAPCGERSHERKGNERNAKCVTHETPELRIEAGEAFEPVTLGGFLVLVLSLAGVRGLRH